MGITIGYQGSLDDPTQLAVLVDELKLVAQRLAWPWQAVDKRILGQAYVYRGAVQQGSMMHVYSELVPIDDRIRGIQLQPPETETFSLTFNREGRLMDYPALPGRFKTKTLGEGDKAISVMSFEQEPGYYQELTELWVKTTGALEAHRHICEVLQLVQKKYISKLQVTDDTGFFHSGDEAALRQEHYLMSSMIDLFNSPAGAKALVKLAGLEGVEDIKPLDPNIKTSPPEWSQDRGVSANEN